MSAFLSDVFEAVSTFKCFEAVPTLFLKSLKQRPLLNKCITTLFIHVHHLNSQANWFGHSLIGFACCVSDLLRCGWFKFRFNDLLNLSKSFETWKFVCCFLFFRLFDLWKLHKAALTYFTKIISKRHADVSMCMDVAPWTRKKMQKTLVTCFGGHAWSEKQVPICYLMFSYA